MKRANLAPIVVAVLLAAMVSALLPASSVQADVYWSANITADTTYLTVANTTAEAPDHCVAAVAADALSANDTYDIGKPGHAPNNYMYAFFEYTFDQWAWAQGLYYRDVRPIPPQGGTDNWTFTIQTDITTNATNPIWIAVSHNATGGFELYDLTINATVPFPYSYYGDLDRDFLLTFRGDTESPPIPIAYSPGYAVSTNQTEVIDTATPTLTWSAVSDNETGNSEPATYDLQVAYDTAFTTLAVNETGLAKSGGDNETYNVTGPLTRRHHYWRVRAVDNANNSSNWTEALDFVLQEYPIERKVIITGSTPPAIGTNTDTAWLGIAQYANPEWDLYDVTETVTPPVPGLLLHFPHPLSDINSGNFTGDVKPADNVTWGLAVVGDFTVAAANVTLTFDLSDLPTAPKTYGVELLESGTENDLCYPWTTNTYTFEATSNVTSTFDVRVMLDVTAPAAANLTSPADGANTTDATPIFQWEAVQDPTGISYTFVTDNDSDCGSPLVTPNVITTQYTLLQALPADGVYYWQVTAIDGAGLETKSAIRSFRLDNTPPDKVSLNTPADEATTPDTTPTFTWDAVVDPTDVTYTLVLDSDSNCLNPFLTKTGLPGPTYTLDGGEALEKGTYYWRVRAIDGVANEGDWSDIRTLIVRGGVRIYRDGVWTKVDYETIGGAITAAEAGDVLVVYTSTYRELVTVNKAITLKSVEGAAYTIIDATGLGSTTVNISAAGVTLGEKGLGFTITGASGSGVKVNAPSCNITGNIIGSYKPGTTTYTNDIGISLTDNGTSCIIKYNDIDGNTSNISVTSAVAVNATYNWWGNASGPGGIGPGTGDNVTANVAYEPWLTNVSATVVASGFAYFGYELSLGEGWNIFSTPFALDSSANSWGELETLGDGLSLYDASTIWYYNPAESSPWQQAITATAIEPMKAYYVRMESADKASMLLNPIGFASQATVYAGWNLISLSSLPDEAQYMKATEALIDIYYGTDGVAQGYTRVRSPDNCNQPAVWWYYRDVTTINDDHNVDETGWMHVGHGYWVYMKTASTLGAHVTYPVLLPD